MIKLLVQKKNEADLMCTIPNPPNLKERPQKGRKTKRTRDSLHTDNIGTNEKICCNKKYVLQTRNDIKHIMPIPVKITILHTKEERIIMKSDEDSRKSWYFTRV